MGKKTKERDCSRDYACEYPIIPDYIRSGFREYKFNKCLKIVLYGEPFKDSRPRINKQTQGVGMVNMQKMKKVFKVLYQKSELLQNLTILSPFVMILHCYDEPSQVMRKRLKQDKQAMRLYERDLLGDQNISDLDNTIKIHNDILFEPEFRITLDDASNVGITDSKKFLSEDPRVELYLYYSTKPLDFYLWRIQENHHYFKWQLSEKHMKMYRRDVNKQRKHLIKTMDQYIAEKKPKGFSAVKTILKRIITVLEEYPADLLKEIAGVTEVKTFHKNNAILKIVIMGTKKYPEFLEMIGKFQSSLFQEESQHKKEETPNAESIPFYF